MHPERMARGTSNANAKLDDDKVRTIRREVANGVSSRVFAERYGVAKKNILEVIRGNTWKHVT